MSEPTIPESRQMPDDRLDAQTERLIFNVTDAGIAHGFAHEDAPTDKMYAAENALRSRIRELVSEAQREGYRMRIKDVELTPDV